MLGPLIIISLVNTYSINPTVSVDFSLAMMLQRGDVVHRLP